MYEDRPRISSRSASIVIVIIVILIALTVVGGGAYVTVPAGYRGIGLRLMGRSLVRYTYANNGVGNPSHWSYNGCGAYYLYFVENWIDQDNSTHYNCVGSKSYSTSGPGGFESNYTVGYHYYLGNYYENSSYTTIEVFNDRANEIEGAIITNIIIKGNYFSDIVYQAPNCSDIHGLIWFIGQADEDSDWVNCQIDGNYFSEESETHGVVLGNPDQSQYKFSSGISITNNDFGENIPSNKHWCCNAVDTGVQSSGNTTSSTDYSKTDPGQWEFTAPTISAATRISNTLNTVTATDGDSGLGSTARWPFTNGALIQANSGNNYSEVIDYSTSPAYSFSITPTNIRVADVDHNWTGLHTTSSTEASSIRGISGSGFSIH